MSWLDANEVFFMDLVNRERVEELRSATAVPGESAHDTDGPADGARDAGHRAWCLFLSAARA